MSVYLKRFMKYKWGKDVFLHSTKIGFPLSQRTDFRFSVQVLFFSKG